MTPQIDRVTNGELRQLNDLDGIVFLYMDGSPQDAMQPAADGGLHTMVLVCGPSQSIDLREKESEKPFFKQVGLQEAKDRNNQIEYRAKIVDIMTLPETSERLQVLALTYDESEAMRAKDVLLKKCYGDVDRTGLYSEDINQQNRRTMASFPSFFINGQIAEGKLNAILPLFIISEFLASVHEKIEAMYHDLGQEYVGLIVFSDKICGDGLAGTPKAAIVNGILQGWYADRIRVHYYEAAPSKAGEYLADNISGMLNECARDPNSPAWKAVRVMKAGRSLHWLRMDHAAAFQPMTLP